MRMESSSASERSVRFTHAKSESVGEQIEVIPDSSLTVTWYPWEVTASRLVSGCSVMQSRRMTPTNPSPELVVKVTSGVSVGMTLMGSVSYTHLTLPTIYS